MGVQGSRTMSVRYLGTKDSCVIPVKDGTMEEVAPNLAHRQSSPEMDGDIEAASSFASVRQNVQA